LEHLTQDITRKVYKQLFWIFKAKLTKS